VLLVATNKAMKNGIIYSRFDVFNKLKKVKLLCFDKTNTLTEPPSVLEVKGEPE
jgi:cation transport ATPase